MEHGWTRSEMTAPLQAWDTSNTKAIGRVRCGGGASLKILAGSQSTWLQVPRASTLAIRWLLTGATLSSDGYTVFCVVLMKFERAYKQRPYQTCARVSLISTTLARM